MTISKFDHIDSELIRDLCNGQIPYNSGVLSYACGYISKFAELDCLDPTIPFDVSGMRMAAAFRANHYLDKRQHYSCLCAIREFWTN